MRFQTVVLLLIGSLGGVRMAHGAAFAINELGVRAMGMAGAFAATADDGSAIFYNPAGIAFQGGTQFQADILAVIPNFRFFPSNAPSGQVVPSNGFSGLVKPHFIPIGGMYATRPITPKITVGFGIFVPFGLASNYENFHDSDPALTKYPARFAGDRAQLQEYWFQPTVAYKLTPNSSIAGGVASGASIAGASIPGRETAPRALGASDVDVSEPGGTPLRIPAGGFAQVGRAANAALVAAVMQAVGDDPGDVLELYAGSGNFTRHLVTRSRRVVAHDADAPAVARGRRNAGAAVWWAGRPPVGQDGAADTVLVDPPREGLDGENFAATARARRRVVYVSCDPQTLGRDATKLVAHGFRLRSAVALDLMPQTFHVEVVATFDR